MGRAVGGGPGEQGDSHSSLSKGQKGFLSLPIPSQGVAEGEMLDFRKNIPQEIFCTQETKLSVLGCI